MSTQYTLAFIADNCISVLPQHCYGHLGHGLWTATYVSAPASFKHIHSTVQEQKIVVKYYVLASARNRTEPRDCVLIGEAYISYAPLQNICSNDHIFRIMLT